MAYERRQDKARGLLGASGLDALLVTDLLNVRYLCGFSGTSGVLLLGPASLFLTDSRYTLQAREETAGVEVREVQELDKAAAELLTGAGVQRLGVEERGLTVSRWRKLAELLHGVELVDVGEPLERLRATKDPAEVDRLADAARLADEALRRTLPRVRTGAEEREIALEFQLQALNLGAEALAFDTIVAGGPRGALPHARPGSRRIERGDLVVFDFGVRLDGYCSDETVTVPVGPVEAEARRVYDVVLRAQGAALAAVRQGVALADVDRAARALIAEAGYGERFGHGTGHGVGLAVHETPTVSSRSKDVAEGGAVFSVEPGIYLADRFGVRLEDVVVVTAEGHRRITGVPKEFGAVWDWAAAS